MTKATSITNRIHFRKLSCVGITNITSVNKNINTPFKASQKILFLIPLWFCLNYFFMNRASCVVCPGQIT